MKKLFYRIFQQSLRLVVPFAGIHDTNLIEKEDAYDEIIEVLRKEGAKKPLVFTGPTLTKLGHINPLLEALKEAGIEYGYFSDVNANPTIKNVNDGVKAYRENNCDSIIAIGGGSPIDCAKVVGALITNKNKEVEDLKGLLKVHKAIPLFIAVPTTAGTGTEASVAAVIVNEVTRDKYAVTSPLLIPDYAVLDAKLLAKLPKGPTAYTGMDCLTHAVESFIGRSNSKKTSLAAKESVVLTYKNLYKSYINGENLEYRKAMHKASYLAGTAFTRAYVGYVHAIAHALGGKYDLAHGYLNAIILPYVLESYGKKAHKRLAELSDAVKLTDPSKSNEEKAKAFILWIKELNASMNIPTKLDVKYNQKDVDKMVKHAYKEANPLYPVPRIFSKKDFEDIYKLVLSN